MKKIVALILLLLLIPLATAATLQGSIYNTNLDLETDVLIEIDTQPAQKFLAKDGTYSFELVTGKYVLTARKGFSEITEDVSVSNEGTFTLDLFLLSDVFEEDELW